MNKILISVIIINWNGEKYLDRCLKSLKYQSFKNFETIVVDNKSTDNSVKIIKKKFPEIILLKNSKNLGYSKGIRVGFLKAKGKYILILNNDISFEKNFINKIYKFYLTNNYDVVAPLEKSMKNIKKRRFNSTIDPTGSPMYFYPSYKKEKLFYLCGVSLFFSKNLYIETKGLDEDFFMYFEDVDWFWRLSLFGKKYSYADNIFINHVGAGSSYSNKKFNLLIFKMRNRNMLQMLIKNYSTFSLIIFIPLYVVQNLFEITFFLLILKPKIALTYLDGWFYNLKILKKTLMKRKWVQGNRVVGELEIYKKMYLGPSKLITLLNFR